jgi:lipopolysaccharide transport system permease protein
MELNAPPQPQPTGAAGPVTIIEPPRGWITLNFAELWQYRELFGFLVWRGIKVRYKQTLLGLGWAVIVPLVQMVVFTFMFGRLGGLPSDGLPQHVYYMLNLVLWRFFQQGVTQTSGSLVNSANLLTKVYFPRLIIPTATMLRAIIDFAIAMVMLLIVMTINFENGQWAPVVPAASSWLIVVPLALSLATGLGVGLFFAALNVRYRDVTEITPLLLQVWMFASVVVPFSKLIEKGMGGWAYLYALNPVGSAIEGFRWCMAHHRMTVEGLPIDSAVPWTLMALSAPLALGMLVLGVCYFKRLERQFADVI